ncbi:MAG: hypothetical protein QOI12_4392 [Alphaproteobacteria bacterium]|jgi:uncharacterized protein YodC (DUF2158 family)|nr:hypothetical protein [Alphaproteobacteria bacterium]
MDFQAGDLVQLKSGSPLMTVEQTGKKAYTEEDAVWCVWSEKVGNKQVVQRETFPPAVLEKSKKPGAVSVGVLRRA